VTRARALVHLVVPFRVRRALGVTLFRARHEWFRGRPAVAAAPPPQLPPPLPLVPEGLPSERLSFPRCDDPVVSIVVPAHDHWEHTHLSLRAVLEHTEGPPYEILLADDASTDETAEAERMLDNVRIVRAERRRGFLENCNAASQVARGRYLLLLNNDTVVQPGWLRELVSAAERSNDVGIVGAKLLQEDGRLLEGGGMIFSDGTAAQYGRDDDPRRGEYNYLKEVDYVSGCCLLVRTELWRALGGFDPVYSPGYYEDVDLAFRVRRSGYRVVYQPRASVVHVEGVSHGRALDEGIKRFLLVNAEKFRARWSDVLEREQAPPGEEHLARDRSSNRLRVLVVDHEVPEPDRDAGSRYVRMYLEVLLRMGYAVTFVSEYREPTEPYARELREAGVEVLSGLSSPEAKWEWFERHGGYLDVVYLHRPFVAGAYVEVVRRQTQARLVYSPVDLHFVREQRRFELTGDIEAGRLAEEWREKEVSLLREADIVHVVSTYEADLVRELVPGVRVRALPIYVYDGAESASPTFDERRNLMFVGGFMHPPNCDAVLWFVQEIFPLVRQELPGVLTFVVGSNPPPEIAALAGDGAIVTGRVTDGMLADLYRQTRVVVCPLRYGAGAKGKLVEALYYGVPAVATPIAAEGLPDIEPYVALASTADDFAHAIVELYSDRSSWSRRAETAEYIRRHFSREAVVRAIQEDFELAPMADAGLAGDRTLSSARRVASM
jgi:O-antigen biosynthesis protein